MRFFKIFSLLYILLLAQSLCCFLLCREIKPSYEYFKLNNGSVHSLYLGENHFVWVATDMGISRFDGFRFHNYPLKYSAASSSNPSFLAVNEIDGNQDGLLFLQLQQGGIACFDSRNGQYIPVGFAGNSFDERTITTIYVADKGLLYIGTTTGMYCAEVKYVVKENAGGIEISLSKPLLTGYISEIVGDDKGNLFICLNSKTVLQYSMGTQQTREFRGGSESVDTDISTIYLSGVYLFVFPKHGTPACYNTKGNERRLLPEISDICVTDVDGVGRKTFYLSSHDGLFNLKFDSDDLIKAPFVLQRLSDEKQLTTVLWDSFHEVLWAGFKGEGLRKWKIAKENGRYDIPFGSVVTGMAEDANGYIWLATERNGIWKSTSSALSQGLIFEHWGKEGGIKDIRCLYKDKAGNLWIGCKDSRVIFVDPVSSKSYIIQLNPDSRNDFRASTESICLDGQDRLWIATSEGLVLLDRKSGNCSLVVKSNSAQDLKVYSVSVDAENNIWVGTSNGLKRLNMLPGKIELTGQYEKDAGWEPADAKNVYVNKANQVFVSYSDRTMRVDPSGKQAAVVFNLQDNLKNGAVLCMADDRDGNTWMGCSSGIAVLRSRQNTLYNVYYGENCEKVCSLKNGHMLWAGPQGLFYFASVGETNRKKELVLSDVGLNGELLSLEKSMDGQWVFDKESNFHFYFSDIHFDGTSQAIAYRLLPDENWQSGILDDGISYSGLSGGKYRLQVKLIYPDGSEGDMLEIPVTIKNAWWQSEWAYMLYGLLAAGMLLLVYLFVVKRNKKANISISGSSMEVGQGIIFGRFMQELRTPLSVIVDLLKEFIQNKGDVSNASSKLLVAYRNSVGLRKACDQMLDIRSQIYMNKSLKVAPYSLSKITDAFLYSVNELLRVYPIEFDYQKEDMDAEVWIDMDKIMFLLRNLLANAFVRMRYTGKITLAVHKVLEGDKVYCSVTISDSGKRIVKDLGETTENELVENESVVVILGLEVMKDIIHRHHGFLTIENNQEGETTVVVKLSTEKEVFSNDQNVEFVSPVALDKPDFSVDNLIDLNVGLDEEDLPLIFDENGTEVKKDRDKPTILIVEDNMDILLYLKVLFENEYNVLQAVNGVEGVKVAKKELPDVIVSDIMMPLKDGFQCCKEIKEGLDTCHIPFIMLTAKIEDEDVVKGLEVGADDYILKPFKPNILKARVKSLIQGRQSLKNVYTELLKPSFLETEVPGDIEVNTNVEDPFIGSVIKIIEENIQQEDFSVKKLAFELNMSQPTLYRKVKQSTDFTIIELIRGVRLRKAATLLQTKRYPVQEVAEMVGYNDIPTFRKHFVDMFGSTPSTYASSNK